MSSHLCNKYLYVYIHINNNINLNCEIFFVAYCHYTENVKLKKFPPNLFEFVQDNGFQNSIHHTVGITVWTWSAILEIAFAFVWNTTWNTNTAASVSNTRVKVMDWWSFMFSSQSTLVVFASSWIVSLDVEFVAFWQFLNSILNSPGA